MLISIKTLLKRSSLVRRFLKSHLWMSARYWRGCIRHRITLLFGARLTHETYTRFMRVPGQFDALAGPVVDRLKPLIKNRALRIIVIGCSNGSEPYTISSVLHYQRPNLNYEIVGIDIAENALEEARLAQYHREQIYNHELVTEEFVAQTFDIDSENPDLFRIKEEIRKPVDFRYMNVLDSDSTLKLGKADVVFAQNTMFNMKPIIARKIFSAVLSTLNENGVLFIDGADINQRFKLTKKSKLKPLEYKIPEIHRDVMHIRAKGWPNIYWGIEPFWPNRRDESRRYSTVFYRSES